MGVLAEICVMDKINMPNNMISKMIGKKAIIAMSGGVDSAVAALAIKNAGADCIGITMRLFDNADVGEDSKKSCCSLEDAAAAEQVANRLNIPFYIFNLADDFKKQVIERFISEYQEGKTPNPCIDCNRYIKFEKLFTRAAQLGMDYVVTGHYARIEQEQDTDGRFLPNSRFLLKKATDKTKDQSYVLYAMTQEQLRGTLFPLGGLTKSKVREIAAENGFKNANKPDSQDICFVRNGDYAGFIAEYTSNSVTNSAVGAVGAVGTTSTTIAVSTTGNFIDKSGKILGQHNGHIRYTIGQRKGLGIAFGKPMYVCDKNPADNTVTLSEEDGLYSQELYAKDFNWISLKEAPTSPIKIKAKIRYNQEETPATACAAGDNVKIVFDEPKRAIAKGQAVVLYDGDIVVGGGTIL